MHIIDLAQLTTVIGGQNQSAANPPAAANPQQPDYYTQAGICPPDAPTVEDPIAKFYRRGGD